MAALVAERSTPDIRKWLLWTANGIGCGSSEGKG
jgi:hypothetical protein